MWLYWRLWEWATSCSHFGLLYFHTHPTILHPMNSCGLWTLSFYGLMDARMVASIRRSSLDAIANAGQLALAEKKVHHGQCSYMPSKKINLLCTAPWAVVQGESL